MVVSNATVNVSGWLSIGHGQGSSGQTASATLTNAAVQSANLRMGYDMLAVGVAFGAAAAGLAPATLMGAIALAIGIGLQNYPEGMAVSVPLRREGMSRLKSFWYGQLSGMVEPAAGVIGVVAVMASRALLPYALSFATGAMIFVVFEQVIPESQHGGNAHLATMGGMLGFTVMMVLDVALG